MNKLYCFVANWNFVSGYIKSRHCNIYKNLNCCWISSNNNIPWELLSQIWKTRHLGRDIRGATSCPELRPGSLARWEGGTGNCSQMDTSVWKSLLPFHWSRPRHGLRLRHKRILHRKEALRKHNEARVGHKEQKTTLVMTLPRPWRPGRGLSGAEGKLGLQDKRRRRGRGVREGKKLFFSRPFLSAPPPPTSVVVYPATPVAPSPLSAPVSPRITFSMSVGDCIYNVKHTLLLKIVFRLNLWSLIKSSSVHTLYASLGLRCAIYAPGNCFGFEGPTTEPLYYIVPLPQ